MHRANSLKIFFNQLPVSCISYLDVLQLLESLFFDLQYIYKFR